jgi:hypothetical protein
MNEIAIVFSEEAKEVFDYLKCSSSKVDRSILRSLLKKVEILKNNPHYGDSVSKRLIPKEYVLRYEINNLFRIELSNYWRLLYTLTNQNDVEIIAFVLDVMNHKKYDKKFGYG